MFKDKKKIKLYAVFAALVLSITAYAVFGDNGLSDFLKYKKEKDKLNTQHIALVKENEVLTREIELLKKDKRYMEKTAREELGMVGKNEILYKKEK